MRRSLAASLIAMLAAVPSLHAQSLRDQLENLFTFGTCGEPLCLNVGTGHGDHFIPAVSAGQTSVIGFVTESVARSASNLPISASSGGATYSIVNGLPVRTSTSPGPIFVERSQTLGRGRVFLGANVSSIHFTTLNSTPTDNLLFAFGHENVGDSLRGEPSFENDVITMTMQLNVDQLVTELFATYGVTDFIDVGVAVPFVRVSVQGNSTAQINPFGPNTPHFFAGDATNPVLRATSTVDDAAAGLGDVVGRFKVNLGQSNRFGAAILGEARFPTGDSANLLGSGAMSIRGLAIASAQFGALALHTNLGYVARTGDFQTDGVLATLALDNQMTPWATLAAGLHSEWQVGDNPLTLPAPIVLDTPYVRTIPATNIMPRREDRLDAALGMKFTVRGGTVVVLNGIVPMRKASLQPDFIWTVELNFAF
jgi:hypothetical protein